MKCQKKKIKKPVHHIFLWTGENWKLEQRQPNQPATGGSNRTAGFDEVTSAGNRVVGRTSIFKKDVR